MPRSAGHLLALHAVDEHADGDGLRLHVEAREHLARQPAIRRALGRCGDQLERIGRRALAAPPSVAEDVQAVVGGDAVDPGERRLALRQLPDVAHHLHEDLLGGVPRRLAVPEQTEAAPVDGRTVLPVEGRHPLAAVRRRFATHAANTTPVFNLAPLL